MSSLSADEQAYNIALLRIDVLMQQLAVYQDAVLAQAELIEAKWIGSQARIDEAHKHLAAVRKQLRDIGGPYEALFFDHLDRREQSAGLAQGQQS